jgi:hypothetical protein
MFLNCRTIEMSFFFVSCVIVLKFKVLVVLFFKFMFVSLRLFFLIAHGEKQIMFCHTQIDVKICCIVCAAKCLCFGFLLDCSVSV